MHKYNFCRRITHLPQPLLHDGDPRHVLADLVGDGEGEGEGGSTWHNAVLKMILYVENICEIRTRPNILSLTSSRFEARKLSDANSALHVGCSPL